MLPFFDEDSQIVIDMARSEVTRRHQSVLSLGHIIIAVLDLRSSAGFKLISARGLDTLKIRDLAENEAAQFPIVVEHPNMVLLSAAVRSVFGKLIGTVHGQELRKLNSADLISAIACWYKHREPKAEIAGIVSSEFCQGLDEAELSEPLDTLEASVGSSSDEELISKLSSSSVQERRSAFEELCHRRQDDLAFFMNLLIHLSFDDIRMGTIHRIFALHEKNDALFDLMVQWILDSSPTVGIAVFSLMKELGQLSIPSMFRLQEHPHPFIKKQARLFVELYS